MFISKKDLDLIESKLTSLMQDIQRQIDILNKEVNIKTDKPVQTKKKTVK